MSGHTNAPLADKCVAAAKAEVMPVLMRILDAFPYDSEVVGILTWLFVNLAVDRTGCELLLFVQVPTTLASYIHLVVMRGDAAHHAHR
jgi:hypothetical protein